MQDNMFDRYVYNRLGPPSGNSNKFEFGRKDLVHTNHNVTFDISGDIPSEGEQCMSDCNGSSIRKHWQTHNTCGEVAVPHRFEAKHLEPAWLKKSLVTT